ncbi:MAG TPA: ATP-binding protein [bacterium]
MSMPRLTQWKLWLFGDDTSLGQALRRSQMAVATKGTPPLAIGTMANSALVAYVMQSFVPWPVLGVWVLINWLAAVQRLRAWHRHRHDAPSSGVRRRGVVRVTWWSTVAGLMWGMAALPLIWGGGIPHELFMVFVIAGHAAIAATWLSTIPSAYWAYLFPCMLPLIGTVLARDTDWSGLLAIMLSLYTGVLAHFGWAAFRNFRDSVQANVEREEAMRQLAQSKAEVERRVEERTTELRREQRLMQGIFDSVPIWLFVKDSTGRFLAVNQHMAKDLGMEPQQILGKRLAEVSTLPDDAADTDAWSDRQALESGKNVGLRELRCTPADGRLHTLRMVKVPVIGGQGDDCVVGAAEDITERNRLEQQLQDAQKLQAVGQLAGGVAHEFNNLLQVIKGFTHLALRELRPQDPARNHLIRVIDSTVTAASLTSQLLAFGRRDIVRRESIDLAALMHRMASMLRTILGEGIEVALSQEPGLPVLMADRGMIEQTVMNLCLNAKEAMPKGGKLTIETHSLQAEEPVNHLLGLDHPGTYLEIRIIDTGTGMPPEVMERIFEPFFTTKEVGNGSGLGLAVAYGIVAQHGGKIRVQSRPGEGAKFSIFLPAAKPESLKEAPTDTAVATFTPRLGRTSTILVAEDDDGVRHLAVQLLELEGYRVIHASDGDQAVRAWENAAEPVDLLVLDLVMPGQGGREAYERIASLQPDIPVIFCTGYVSDTLDTMFLANSKATLLRKPYPPDRLLQVVREALLSSRQGNAKHEERPQYPV